MLNLDQGKLVHGRRRLKPELDFIFLARVTATEKQDQQQDQNRVNNRAKNKNDPCPGGRGYIFFNKNWEKNKKKQAMLSFRYSMGLKKIPVYIQEKKISDIADGPDCNQRFISGAFIVVMILEVGGWIFV